MMLSLLNISIGILLFAACSAKSGVIQTDQLETGTRQAKRIIQVATATELKKALAAAEPGDSIVLKDGRYAGKFVISNSGTKAHPVFITGTKDAILDAGSISSGYVLHITGNYNTIKGFTVQNGLKGIMTDGVTGVTIDGVHVTRIGTEGIHLRSFSSKNTVQNCIITYVGLETPDYGEGIYIGSAKNNWGKYSNGQPDNCDSNRILNNTIGPFVTAECIDIKEGTTGGLIKGNHFNSEGITGANGGDSWMDVKGNNYRIEDNTGYNPGGNTAFADGYQVNCAYPGWGNNNVFKNNKSEVNASGYAINVRLKSSQGEVTGTVVYADNTAIRAAKGLTNITVTP
ncbi:MAG: chondroitinase-B domain-containing protein [Niabella sp.]